MFELVLIGLLAFVSPFIDDLNGVLEGRRKWCVVTADCLDILPLMPKVDAVVTDPPYGIGANKQTLGAGKREFHRGADWDDSAPDVRPLLSVAHHVVIWGGNYFDLPKSNDWLCWHKVNDGRSFSEFELAWTNLGLNCRHLSHHWAGEEKRHPTAKPEGVMLWCVEVATDRLGEVVLDPYCGSGTTGVACLRLGRRFIGIEKDPTYAQVARERLEAESRGLTLKDARAGQTSIFDAMGEP